MWKKYCKLRINKHLKELQTNQPSKDEEKKSPEEKKRGRKKTKNETINEETENQRVTRSRPTTRNINNKILNRTELGLVGSAVVMKYKNTKGFVWKSKDNAVSKGWKDKFLARNKPVGNYFDSKSRQIPKDLRERVQSFSDEFKLDIKIPKLHKSTKN